MPADVHDEDALVAAVDDVLTRYRDQGLEALAFAGTLGRDDEGTFTCSTAGSCATIDELHGFLDDRPRIETAIQVADLLAREDVHAVLRALICRRAPPPLDPVTTSSLCELGLVEATPDGTCRISNKGQLTYLVFFSIAGAHRRVALPPKRS